MKAMCPVGAAIGGGFGLRMVEERGGGKGREDVAVMVKVFLF